VSLLAWLDWPGIFFLGALVISSNGLMIIYSGIVFDCHLVITPLAVFLLSLCLQVPKGKEEE
jgi:hypothetical protein